MSVKEIRSRIESASDAQSLDRFILEASDFIECGEGDVDELRRLFRAIVERIELVGDREEAMNCLSHCAVALESVRELDLSKLVALLSECNEGEVLAVINILANSDQVEYLETLRRLSEAENEEISEEAVHAMDELRSRTT